MKLLEKLCLSFGPSGSEDEISRVIENEMSPFADEIYRDAMGNLICHKKGSGKKIMLCAHMDEIGLMVTFIEETGYLRCAQIGYLPPFLTLNRFCSFENGKVGVIAYENEHEEKLKQDKVFIDIGAENKEEAEKLVSVGDTCVIKGGFEVIGEKISAKALDNRAGCFALIEAAKKCESENDLYFVFTTQEEVGLRGALCVAESIKPDMALSVDVTLTGDTPESGKNSVSLGKGVAIKVMDNSIITGAALRNKLIAMAVEKNIPYQMEVLKSGGTDAGAIHTSAGGILTGGISIPARYVHSATETIDKRDIDAAIKLITAFLKKA